MDSVDFLVQSSSEADFRVCSLDFQVRSLEFGFSNPSVGFWSWSLTSSSRLQSTFGSEFEFGVQFTSCFGHPWKRILQFGVWILDFGVGAGVGGVE